jgi:pantetheine-phosphate adenylyltransferase
MQRKAVYAGSFDPPTNGHIDILARVQPHFDKILVVVAFNPRKKTLFSASERVKLLDSALREKLPSGTYEVHAHDALLIDFCRTHKAKTLIRGLRAISDFENEVQMAAMNRRLAPEIETFHVMTDEKFSFISSSLIRELAYFDAPLNEWVPEPVVDALKRKMKEK